MVKVLVWLGLFVGTPSAGVYAGSVYFKFVDPFLVLFLFSAVALVVAILPCLIETDSKSPARDG
jgi:hypothetical protein